MNKQRHFLTAFAVFICTIVLLAVGVLAADLHHDIKPMKVISPDTSVSANDNTAGTIIDRLGYESVEFVIATGTLADTDMTLTPEVAECGAPDCSDAVIATASKLLGTIAGATFLDFARGRRR